MNAFNSLTGQWAATAKNDKTEAQAAELQALFDKAIQSTSDSDKASAYQAVQKYIEDNRIVVPIFERLQDTAFSSKVHGLRFTADSFGDFYGIWLG